MKVTIKRARNLIQVTPALKDLLTPKLTYKKRIQLSGSAKDTIYQQTLLCRVIKTGDEESLLVPAGLTQRVSKLLVGAGHQIDFVDLRTDKLSEPAYENLDLLREGQEEIITAVIVNDFGVIEAPTGAGKSFLVRQMCKLWPSATIVIACYSATIIDDFYRELLKILPVDQVGMCGGGRNETKKRVTCCVDRSLGKLPLERVDLFVYDEVHRAAAPSTAEMITSRVVNAKMIGMSASSTGRGDNADLETEAMFGPRIITKTYQEVQATGAVVPIEVHVFGTNEVAPCAYQSTNALERNGLWRNETRNKIIRSALQWAFKQYGEDTQTLVTVETVEHAAFLHQLMPDFELAYRTIKPDKLERWQKWDVLPEDFKVRSLKELVALKNEFHAGTVRRAIATSVWGTGVDFPQLGILVRADAQGAKIANTQLPGRVTRKSDGKHVGIVIDFDDVFNEALKKRAQNRLAIYRKKGWTIHLHQPQTAYLTS